jgi:hypothetical protein
MTMRRTLVAGLALALILAPALAGCSVIEDTIEQVTGGDVEIGGNTVPEDFPSEVPLADGDVINGSSASKDNSKVWNVTIKAADGVTFDSLATELEAAGFARQEVGSGSSEAETALFNGTTYSVLLAMTTQDGLGTIANYTVTKIA